MPLAYCISGLQIPLKRSKKETHQQVCLFFAKDYLNGAELGEKLPKSNVPVLLDKLEFVYIKILAYIFFPQNPMEQFCGLLHGNHIFHINSHGHLLNTLYQNQHF